MVKVTRYDFPVPEWTRVIYTSQEAKELWEPRLARITAAWDSVERASVGNGVRRAALQMVDPSQLGELTSNMSRVGLMVAPLEQAAVTNSYQSGRAELRPGQPWNYRVVICHPEVYTSFVDAYNQHNDDLLGFFLGFPPCCRAFFDSVWNKDGWRDTTWMMAMNTPGCHLDTSPHPWIDVGEHPTHTPPRPVECNILLRWVGARWVTHLPCSFSCDPSREIGVQMRTTMITIGFGQEAAWLDELLGSPMEWSSYHGIAEIRHPVLKISAKTDATREKLAVRRPTGSYPAGGSKGLGFPFRRHPEAAKPQKPAILRWLGLGPTEVPTAEPDSSPKEDDSTVHNDLGHVDVPPAEMERATREAAQNGFSSYEAMLNAHDALHRFVGGNHGCVIDLGCGNGRLVNALAKHPAGVEQDPERAAAARARHVEVFEGSIESFIYSDVEIAHRVHDLALIAENRFKEMTIFQAAELRQWLAKHANRVCVYSYESVPPKAWWL